MAWFSFIRPIKYSTLSNGGKVIFSGWCWNDSFRRYLFLIFIFLSLLFIGIIWNKCIEVSFNLAIFRSLSDHFDLFLIKKVGKVIWFDYKIVLYLFKNIEFPLLKTFDLNRWACRKYLFDFEIKDCNIDKIDFVINPISLSFMKSFNNFIIFFVFTLVIVL